MTHLTTDPILQKVLDTKSELVTLLQLTNDFLMKRHQKDQLELQWLRRENKKLNNYIIKWLDTNVYSLPKKEA